VISLGRISIYLVALSFTYDNHLNCWFFFYYFFFSRVTCYSLTSWSLNNSLTVLLVCCDFNIFYTLFGRPLHAGLSIFGNFYTHDKNCEYLIPSGMVNGISFGSYERYKGYDYSKLWGVKNI